MASGDSPASATEAFIAQYARAPPDVQTAVNAEIVLIERAPDRHGSIYIAGWDVPIRWVVVGDAYGLYWKDLGNGQDFQIVALLSLPSRLLV